MKNATIPMPFNQPEQLLWTLYYLKVYPTWDQMAMTTGITEKTLRKWVGVVVDYLASIENWVRTVRLRSLAHNSSAFVHSLAHNNYFVVQIDWDN
jgi:hypothetical protein